MRVLIVNHSPTFGGPHNEMIVLDGPFAEAGVELVALLSDGAGTAADRVAEAGIPTVRMPLHRLRATPNPGPHLGLVRGWRPEIAAIRSLLRDRGVDAVMVMGLVNPHAAVAARREGVAVVWKLVDTRAPDALRRSCFALVRRYADAVVFTGRAVRDLHVGRRPLRQPCFSITTLVDPERFRPDPDRRRAARERLGIPLDAPVVGMVANLNPQKGIEYLVRAAGAIHERHPEVRFLIVGSRHDTHRAYTERIEDEIERSPVPTDRFLLTGYEQRPELLLPAMDVKVISSVPRSEGIPTTAAEAMACGLPVVATDVAAISEVVEDGETGFVVPPRDPDAIATAASELLADPALRSRIGAEGRKRAETLYTPERFAADHLQALRAALEYRDARG